MKRASPGRGPSGFTLLEVLAAVAIFAIWFTWLAATVISGVAREGRSQRRIEASLIADEVLADFDSQTLLGGTSKLDANSYGDDLFEVHIDQSPFDLAGSVVPAGSDTPLPEGLDLEVLAGGGGSAASSILVQVRVAVTWLEGFDEWTVSRTTYVLDSAGLEALAAVGQAGEGSEGPTGREAEERGGPGDEDR